VPTKLQIAHSRAARIAELSGGSLLVGLSGKDSFVTLDIAAQHFKRIVAFHMYHVRLECEDAPLRAMCARHKTELVWYPHPSLFKMLKHAVYRPHLAALDDAPMLKLADIYRLARLKSGIGWIALGERLSDSFARRLFWRKLDGAYEKGQRCTFITEWLDEDVGSYMRTNRLPAPCTFGATTRGTGFEISAQSMGWLQCHHPADYQRVLRVFPGAATELLVARA